MEMKKLPLTAEKVEVRINQVRSTEYGYYATLLLYQESRASMDALDYLFDGRWKRSHQLIGDQVYCTISVWDPDLKEWLSRTDVGSAGEFEAEKAKASDSFKRAAVNFIPAFRALYKAPDIKFKLNDSEVYSGEGKPKCYEKFVVAELEFDEVNQVFSKLKIVDKNGEVRFDIQKASNIPQKISQNIATSDPIATTGVNRSYSGGYRCSDCGASISDKVHKFSHDKYGKDLCMSCQKKAQRAA